MTQEQAAIWQSMNSCTYAKKVWHEGNLRWALFTANGLPLVISDHYKMLLSCADQNNIPRPETIH